MNDDVITGPDYDRLEGLALLRREFGLDGVAPKENKDKLRRRCAMRTCSGRVRQAKDDEILEVFKDLPGQHLLCEKCGVKQHFTPAGVA